MSNDDQPLSPSDAIFARAYANAIKTKFQIDVGDHFEIQTSPVTQRGMAAGDLIYPQMTNYLIYKFADALQYSDSPSYTGGSAGSYIQQLRSYIDWVKTSSDPSQVVVARMSRARDAATAANAQYFKVLGEAQKQYNSVKELYPNMTFWQWSTSYYPPLAAADRTRKSAQTELYQAMQAYFGPDASTLSTYMDNIASAQGAVPMPGYNQDGLVDDQDMIASAVKYANSGVKPPEQSIVQSTIRVPAYSIATYVSGVQAWITAAGNGAARDQAITIDIDQGRNTSWEDYGFKQVSGGGGSGFWPFFWTEVYYNNKWERHELNTSEREDSVSIQLSMIGIQKFDVRPGEWDVANIKALFPNRLPDAPDVLSSKYAKISSVLVGYDVELKVNFASEMREEVSQMYDEVKQSSGRMGIFGFFIGGGGSSTEHVHTSFDDVKWDNTSGTMILTPTAGQVYPTILATVAQRFD